MAFIKILNSYMGCKIIKKHCAIIWTKLNRINGGSNIPILLLSKYLNNKTVCSPLESCRKFLYIIWGWVKITKLLSKFYWETWICVVMVVLVLWVCVGLCIVLIIPVVLDSIIIFIFWMVTLVSVAFLFQYNLYLHKTVGDKMIPNLFL